MQEREFERRSANLNAQLLLGDRSVACDICDISLGGAMLRAALPLGQGAAVTLSIDPYGRLAATAVWNRGDLSGLRFTDSSAHISEILAAVAIYSGA